jgi:uncharacterized protein with ParB-like and HNH nuclease domain
MLAEDTHLIDEALDLTELLEEEFEPEDEPQIESNYVNSLPDYSDKDRRLVTHPYDFIIRSLKEQVDDGTLVLADKFQRRRVWDDTKASRLIESLLLNVPIPVCYFAELDDGAYSVIDGQQRLTAIYRYIDNQFPLRNLRIRSDLNRNRFHELGVAEQRLIKSRSIRCIVILKESDPDIRFDVFDRLNSSSVRLNAQELRNSLYRGTLNDLIRDLSEDSVFKRVRKVQDVDKRMRDCEMVLRFFAFYFQPEQYRGYLSRFLDKYLQKGQKFNQDTLENHRLIFKRIIEDVSFVFDENAFRRYDKKQGWEKTINKAIYDVIMLYFSKIESFQIRTHKDQITRALQQVCQDKAFNDAITSSTSDISSIQTRLDRWHLELCDIGMQIERIKIGQNAQSK